MIGKIPRKELAIVIRLFAFCLFAGSSYTLAKTAADSLFLSRIGSESLAVEFLAAGIATAIFATLWVRAAKKVSIRQLMRATSILLAVIYLTIWWMLPVLHHSFILLSIVYVMAEVKGALYAIVAISAMNETLGRNSSRQSWATILLGFSVATIVVGTAIGFDSSDWAADNWLLIAGLLDLLAVLPSIRLKPLKIVRKEALSETGLTEKSVIETIKESAESDDADLSSKIASQLLPLTKYADAETFARWFSLLIGVKVLVLTLVGFNWKVSVNEYLGSSERLLAAYFGWYYAISGVATLLVQFFVTGRLLADKSVVIHILVLPAMLLLLNLIFVAGGGIGMSVAFLFYVATSAKAMDTWRRSTHDTAVHLLYTSVEKKKRRGMIGRNQGLVKPTAEIAAGIVLVTSPFWIQQIVLVGASLVWLFTTLVIIGIVKTRGYWLKKKKKKKKKKRSKTAIE